MSHKQTMQRLDEATARIEQIIYIAAAFSEETLSEQLSDALEDPESLLKSIDKKPKWLQRLIDDGEYIDAEAFIEWVACQGGPLGFLVEIATPVMKPHDAHSASFSWGYFNTAWVYGETVDEAMDKGLAWVAERRAAELQKAGITPAGGEATT